MTADEPEPGAGLFLTRRPGWRFPLAHLLAVCVCVMPLFLIAMYDAIPACVSRSSSGKVECALETSVELVGMLLIISAVLWPIAAILTYCLLRLGERRWFAYVAAGAANVHAVAFITRWLYSLSDGYMGPEAGDDFNVVIFWLAATAWGALIGWLFWFFAIRRRPVRRPTLPELSA